MEVKPGYKPEKFAFKRYSLKRFLRKTLNKSYLNIETPRY